MKKIKRFLIVLLVWTILTGQALSCGSMAPLREPPGISTADRSTPKASSKSTQTPLNAVTSGEEPGMSSTGQEELKNEWFVPYTAASILFETCGMMMYTHATFQIAGIDLVEARSELAVEANFIALVETQIVNQVPTDRTGPFLWELDEDMRVLIDVWEQVNSSDDLGGPAMSEILFNACTPFHNNIETIAFAAMDAGVSEASLNEMDAEIQDIIDELINSVNEVER